MLLSPAQAVAVATARAGNVIGGGDWAADRLIPDAVRAWQAGKALAGPQPRRRAPLAARARAARGLPGAGASAVGAAGLAGAYNFGPQTGEAATVRELVSSHARPTAKARSRGATAAKGRTRRGGSPSTLERPKACSALRNAGR